MDLYEIVGDFSDSSSDDEGLSRNTDFRALYEKNITKVLESKIDVFLQVSKSGTKI